MFKKQYYLIFLLVIIASLLILINYNDSKKIVDQNGNEFVGNEACRNCHAELVDSYLHTDHFLDSRIADLNAVKGKFIRDSDYVIYNNDFRNKVVMRQYHGDLYQSHYVDGKEVMSKKMDIIIGSGRKGQSYAYWNNNSLFQLPVSFYTPLDQWIASPGYSTKSPDFSRVITVRCLECHATYAKVHEDTANNKLNFEKNQLILGITCEKCHGAGGKHVEHHLQYKTEKGGKYIINPKKLTSTQQLDACSLCHGGIMKSKLPPFSFQTGDTLSKFFKLNNVVDTSVDVHANQIALLSKSKCFRISNNMTCSTCHNVHQNSRGDLKVYATKCMSCHVDYKKLHKVDVKYNDEFYINNCIDCHMPNSPSKTMTVETDFISGSKPVLIRTHYIKTYADQQKKIVADLYKLVGSK